MKLLAMLCMKVKKEIKLRGVGHFLSHFPEHYMLIMARWFIKPAGILAVMFRQPSGLGRGALMASNTAQLEASGSPLADPSSEEGRVRPFLWHLYSILRVLNWSCTFITVQLSLRDEVKRFCNEQRICNRISSDYVKIEFIVPGYQAASLNRGDSRWDETDMSFTVFTRWRTPLRSLFLVDESL